MAERQAVGVRTLLGTTPKGKEIFMIRVENASVRYIVFGSGGKIPKQLEGGFTSIRMAEQAVLSYCDLLGRKIIRDDGTEIKAK